MTLLLFLLLSDTTIKDTLWVKPYEFRVITTSPRNKDTVFYTRSCATSIVKVRRKLFGWKMLNNRACGTFVRIGNKRKNARRNKKEWGWR